MSPEIMHCLKNEMRILWRHFEDKYLNFPPAEQAVIRNEIEEMLKASKSIKAGDLPAKAFNDLYYENGDDLLNEFLQAMFDCFKEWQKYEGIDLQKSIYEHTNRSTDNWFPVVVINQKINEWKLEGENITLYRGCGKCEFETQKFNQRQSWTKDLSIAKIFAFDHPSSKTSLEKIVVIEAVVNKNDILWDRGAESEVVLKLGFSPISSTIAMSYGDYNVQSST